MSPDEMKRLLAIASSLKARVLLSLGYGCGLRAGEVVRLTLLAPDIVEAILDGRQPVEMTLAVLMRPFPVGWVTQRLVFGH
jgi:integrase